MATDGFSQNSRMICAVLIAQPVEQLLINMHQAKIEGADVVEIRLGRLTSFQELKLLLESKPLPVVVVHSQSLYDDVQFHNNGVDAQEEIRGLILASDLGADYIELEFKVASALQRNSKLNHLSRSKIIVSSYLESLADLQAISCLAAEMQSTGADIIKIVSHAANITELATIFNFLSHSQVPVIAHCTGERGLINHLLSFKFGGAFAYGCIEGHAVPGLPSINNLRHPYAVKNLDKNTIVFGLISKPVNHSKGPLLHNPAFRQIGFNGVYVPMLVDDLTEFFSVYSRRDFAGFSVGIPYKEAVIDFCDEVDPLAQSIGAVNTIVRNSTDGKLVGYNTDCEAAITSIEDAFKECTGSNALAHSPLAGKLFVLVGAGGAGRAIAFGAKTRGARVLVFDIDFDRAKSLAADISAKALPFEDLICFRPEKGAILANATPLGMHPNNDRIPVLKETLGDYIVVFDAVYNPRKTRLLNEAEAAGATTVSGVEMFLRQAAAQFRLFTSRKAPEELMRQIILETF